MAGRRALNVNTQMSPSHQQLTVSRTSSNPISSSSGSSGGSSTGSSLSTLGTGINVDQELPETSTSTTISHDSPRQGSGRSVSTITTIGTNKSSGGSNVGSSSTITTSQTRDATLSSATLKRNPKMELSRSDLLRLLAIVEGELQSREIVIAVLKAEQMKQLLYAGGLLANRLGHPVPKGTLSQIAGPGYKSYDPLNALARDAVSLYRQATAIPAAIANAVASSSLTSTSTLATTDQVQASSNTLMGNMSDITSDALNSRLAFESARQKVDNLILTQRRLRATLKDRLREAESQLETTRADLEAERTRSAQLLSEEAKQLREKQLIATYESDLQSAREECVRTKERERAMVTNLLSERKVLILKVISERRRADALAELVAQEKQRLAEYVEGLEEESKRSLQMEAELERQLADFERDRQSYKNQLSLAEDKAHALDVEVERLKAELELYKKHLGGPLEGIGSGVRSTIVTVAGSGGVAPQPMARSQTSATGQKTSSARPISPKQPLAATAPHLSETKGPPPPPPPIKTSGTTSSSQVLKSAAASVIPTPPSVPAPPPKSPHTSRLLSSQSVVGGVGSPGQPTTLSSPQSAQNPVTSKVVLQVGTGQNPNQNVASQNSIAGYSTSTVRRLTSSLSMGGGSHRGAPPPVPPNKPVLNTINAPSPQAITGGVGIRPILRASNTNSPATTTNTANVTPSNAKGEPPISPIHSKPGTLLPARSHNGLSHNSSPLTTAQLHMTRPKIPARLSSTTLATASGASLASLGARPVPIPVPPPTISALTANTTHAPPLPPSHPPPPPPPGELPSECELLINESLGGSGAGLVLSNGTCSSSSRSNSNSMAHHHYTESELHRIKQEKLRANAELVIDEINGFRLELDEIFNQSQVQPVSHNHNSNSMLNNGN